MRHKRAVERPERQVRARRLSRVADFPFVKASAERITINRAPVLTLWAAVVAERIGYEWGTALTLGRAVAGRTAASKARTLGLAHKRPGTSASKEKPEEKGTQAITLMGRIVPARRTPEGLRARNGDRTDTPESVERYLRSKFGDAYEPARDTLRRLARAFDADDLEAQAFGLYEDFRPAVPRGTRGWGASGVLDLAYVRELADKLRKPRRRE